MDLRCPECGSEELARDLDGGRGAGVPTRCAACGHRWRRVPRLSCPRCGSVDLSDTPIDSWAFDDLEEAREDPHSASWGYVDKTVHHCNRCRHEWSTADATRPYRRSQDA